MEFLGDCINMETIPTHKQINKRYYLFIGFPMGQQLILTFIFRYEIDSESAASKEEKLRETTCESVSRGFVKPLQKL